MKEIQIREINTNSEQYQQLLSFRNRWLRQPLGLDLFVEDLTEDAKDLILVVMDEDEIVGCIMLQPQSGEQVKFRQMAIHPGLRGKGVGKALIEDAEQLAAEQGFKHIVLHARVTARGFYEKMNYRSYGPVFTEVTIPHIAMEKTIG